MADAIFQLLDALVPIVIGIVSVPVFGGIKKILTFIDGWHANVQRIALVVQVWAIGVLANLLNLQLPENLAAFDLSTVEMIVASALAYFLHFVKKQTGK